MERTKQHPWGRCERCGAEGSAHDDLVQRDVPYNGYDRLCKRCQGETENVVSAFAKAPSPVAQFNKPLQPFCNACGWRRGGVDSWDGIRCKCGKS